MRFSLFLSWCRDFLRDSDYTITDLRTLNRGGYLKHHADYCFACRKPHLSDAPSRYKELQLCSNCERCRECCDCPHCGSCDSTVSSLCEVCEECDECCNCPSCARCGDRTSSLCEACEECDSCCSCTHCDGCGSNYRSRDICSDCSNCDDCCNCNRYFFTCELKFYSANIKQFQKNRSKRFIAAEIEVANANDSGMENLCNTVRRWSGSIVSDGSLPSTGFEINTSPANGDVFLTQIHDICERLEQAQAEVSVECGLHVHIDARDYNFYDLRRLIQAYKILEPALFCMVPQSRQNSQYCERCGNHYYNAIVAGNTPYREVKKKVIEAVYERGFDKSVNRTKMKKYPDYGSRYRALNVHSWFYRGTIECRLHSGSVSYEKITTWGMMWAAILDYCCTKTDKDLEKVLTLSPYHLLVEMTRTVPAAETFINSRIHKFNNKTIPERIMTR